MDVLDLIGQGARKNIPPGGTGGRERGGDRRSMGELATQKEMWKP